MNLKSMASKTSQGLRIGLACLAMFQLAVGPAFAGTDTAIPQANFPADKKTTSPIKHVIVIIGENRSFDHVFATYAPKNGNTVNNLLSEGIIQLDSNKNAIPGPNFGKAQQLFGNDYGTFLLNPPNEPFAGAGYGVMPPALTGGASGAFGYFTPPTNGAACPAQPELTPLQCAQETENGLPSSYYPALASGGTGLASKIPDTRITNVNSLQAGPFQLTNSTALVYNDYAASPVHRFYQMWQQEGCSAQNSTHANPSGCTAQLFSYVENTVGAGTNGLAQKPLCSTDGDMTPCFTTTYLPSVPGATTTGEGSTALGFYNVQQGDAPYFESLADNYAMSDNFHQSVDGGTGANHIMFGHGDMIFFHDPNSATPYTPPENQEVFTAPFNGAANPNEGIVNEIENPDPMSGTNNWYTEDGYGGGAFGSSSYGGGSYSNCADPTQPGVREIVTYLNSIGIDPNCQKNRYYLLNNYNPGYFGNGNNAYTDQNPANTPFTVPPSKVPSIGDSLNANGISWKYYGDQWNNYVPDPYTLNYGTNGTNADEYCNICNPFQYDTSIMAHPKQVKAHIADSIDLYADIADGNLPAVSIVKPSGYVDGHPSSSKLNLFEGFVEKIVEDVQASPYWNNTAILITEDEGGGYYDSGYVQPLDFFGDGTRIIFLAVSKFTSPGHISHEYTDHVSILKFIERNWNFGPVSDRSRDNFPNPVAERHNPYVPTNSPAIGDLWDLFSFGK